MSEPSGRLGWGEKTGYSLGDAGSNFYWKVFEFQLVFSRLTAAYAARAWTRASRSPGRLSSRSV